MEFRQCFFHILFVFDVDKSAEKDNENENVGRLLSLYSCVHTWQFLKEFFFN